MKRVRKQPPPLPVATSRFRFARVRQDPLLAILQRVGLASVLLLIVTLITYFGRDGYIDNEHPDRVLSFVDALYYSTVTITTTGYGDIVPFTEAARLVTTVVVTPIRIIFIVLLVGTTLQVLAEQSSLNFRLRRWQNNLGGHVVVCGFGVKGQSALEYIRNHDPDVDAVVIDESDAALEEANRQEITGISGKSYDRQILEAAGTRKAKTVIVAISSDEQAILTVLRVRELNPDATIVSSCKEESNYELLYSSGATEVIVSSSSAGRILGMAADAPDAARVVNDLLTFGDGLDIDDRVVEKDGDDLARSGQTPIAIVRHEEGHGDGKVYRPGHDEGGLPLKAGDRVVFINTRKEN